MGSPRSKSRLSWELRDRGTLRGRSLGKPVRRQHIISTVKVKARVRARLRSLSHGFSMFTGHEM